MNAESPEFRSGIGLWPGRLGSLKLTAVILLLLLAGGVLALEYPKQTTWLMVPPLALFALNLVAAILTYPSIRQQRALLVFHLALLALVLLFAAARLTYLRGQLEVVEGTIFDGQMVSVDAGPLHWNRLDQARFVNLGFSSEFVRGGERLISTRNHVRWVDEAGRQQDTMIGDLEPLTLQGYRFYSDLSAMGFAMIFVWLPESGPPARGSVLLPSYPAFRDKQQQEWTPPGGGRPLMLKLQYDEVILDPVQPSEFSPPKEHRLLVRGSDAEHILAPGGRLELTGGTLVYEGLRRWLGYTVIYDWSVRWILAASAIAALSLGWHFWRKFAAQPWLKLDKES